MRLAAEGSRDCRATEQHHSSHPEWIPRPHQMASIGDLALESGESIADCRLVWVEHGRRDPAGGNTILVLCAIGSTHHRLDFLIGEGLALDPRRFHIVAIDALGNGLSSSPSNSEAQPGPAFPAITIRDMVESQRRLLDMLEIPSLYAVVGASMGGMQALQWAVSHPARVDRVAAMTTMAVTERWSQLANELSRRAMFEDPECRKPRARRDAMRLWTPLTQLMTATTPESVARFGSREALTAFIEAEGARLETEGPDPFDWLCQTRAYDAHDVGTTPGHAGDVAAALKSIRAETLLLAPPLDLYNPAQASQAASSAIPRARFVEIPSARGHRSASACADAEIAFLNRTIGALLG
jgi:homoserine O-acetyltransferase/O-succinyltransferase